MIAFWDRHKSAHLFAKRRGLLLGAMAAPMVSGCFYSRTFDLSWDEEALLHDGRVIVVKLKYIYERPGLLGPFRKYENAILRSTELTFDAGQNVGVVHQRLDRLRPVFIDQKQGRWFLVLGDRGVYGSIMQEWGGAQNANGQWVASLSDGRFRPVSIDELPAEFMVPNLLYDYAPLEEWARFNGTRVTLEQKRQYLERYPLEPIHRVIARPNKRSGEKN